MQLINLKIDKIIIHQVFERDGDGNKVEPKQSSEYTDFDDEAMFQFKKRVNEALGDGSRAVQMQIVNQGSNDLANHVDNMMSQDSGTFATSSFEIAKKLTDAQKTRNIPGGIVVVFKGSRGSNNDVFFGVIKAEVYNGYQKVINDNDGKISIKFVEDLLLTPGNKLYKTAGFFKKPDSDHSSQDLNDKWVVMVSDNQISKTEGKAAAQYFYSDFLGCGYLKTDARFTKSFYEETSDFIIKMDTEQSEKSDLLNALVSYLKVDNSPTVSVGDFAETYFEDEDTQDSYVRHITSASIPDTFSKNTEHIKSKLKFRSIRFKSKVKIVAPSEAFKDLVHIQTIPGEPDESGNPTEWTKVIVKDRIVDQE